MTMTEKHEVALICRPAGGGGAKRAIHHPAQVKGKEKVER